MKTHQWGPGRFQGPSLLGQMGADWGDASFPPCFPAPFTPARRSQRSGLSSVLPLFPKLPFVPTGRCAGYTLSAPLFGTAGLFLQNSVGNSLSWEISLTHSHPQLWPKRWHFAPVTVTLHTLPTHTRIPGPMPHLFCPHAPLARLPCTLYLALRWSVCISVPACLSRLLEGHGTLRGVQGSSSFPGPRGFRKLKGEWECGWMVTPSHEMREIKSWGPTSLSLWGPRALGPSSERFSFPSWLHHRLDDLSWDPHLPEPQCSLQKGREMGAQLTGPLGGGGHSTQRLQGSWAELVHPSRSGP